MKAHEQWMYCLTEFQRPLLLLLLLLSLSLLLLFVLRAKFDLCLLMYRVVHRTAPVYLAELCQPRTDPRTSSIHMRRFRDTTHQPSFHEHFIFFRCTNCLEQTTYTHIRYSYLYNSVIVSIQTQDSTVHYIICCSLVTMYGAPVLCLWSALEDAILIDLFIYLFIYSAALPYRTRPPIFFSQTKWNKSL